MVVEEYEMIDIINNYLDKSTMKPIILGGIAGTSLFEHVFNACMSIKPYEKICIIEGIQDIIGLKHQTEEYWSHYFYADLFINHFMTNQRDDVHFKSFMKEQSKFLKVPSIMFDRIQRAFDIIIVNDAHLIPDRYLNQIKNLKKKIFILVDPFDINGERYSQVPTVLDTLKRLPLLITRARSLYDVDTRVYDKNLPSTFEIGKISKQSIGKLSDKMYGSKDEKVLEYARNKQFVAPSKKNHRMMIMDEHVVRSMDVHAGPHDVVTKYSLVYVTQYSRINKISSFRIYNSRFEIMEIPSYNPDDTKASVHVIPGNILTPDCLCHHRYHQLIYVNGDTPLTTREWYSILKCTRNLYYVE